jgi:Flp pilus assembly protein TadG
MRHDERGIVTVFVAGITVALLMVAGLVVDGGYVLAARREAANVAESAARAGAQVLDTSRVRSDPTAPLDATAATAAAQRFLTVSGHTGTVTVIGDVVRVEVTIEQPTYLLGLAGTRSLQVTGAGEARPVRGVVSEGS